jgi:hypothetical protein
MNKRKRIAALAGAGAMVLALAGTALAADAVPVGHYASQGGDQSNTGAFWVAYLNDNFDAGLSEGDCDTKLEGDDLAAVNNGDGSADLGAAYGWVIVKQASSATVDFDNTIFMDVAADETVYADTNGNNVHDEGDSQGISHIIVCEAGEEETAPPTEAPSASPFQSVEAETDAPTETPFQSVEGDTDAPTEPNTATVGGNGTGAPGDGAWLLVVALGVLLASIVVLTPARAKAPRR